MKRKIIAIVLIASFTFGMTGCASWNRMVTDVKSDFAGGIQRTIKVYTANGDLPAEYEGKLILNPMMVDISNSIITESGISITTALLKA